MQPSTYQKSHGGLDCTGGVNVVPTSQTHPLLHHVCPSHWPCLVSLFWNRMTLDKTWKIFRYMVAGNIAVPVSAFQRLAVASPFKSLTSKSFQLSPYTCVPSKFVIWSKTEMTWDVDLISLTYLMGPGTHPSIHALSSAHLGPGCGGSLSREAQTFLFPANSSSFSRGTPWCS